MVRRASSQLRRLSRVAARYTPADSAAKLDLLGSLSAAALATPAEVAKLHEILCRLRAYPDNPAILRQVVRMLAGFARRKDLRRHRAELADSGIAGTDTRFRFFAATAEWLESRWPEALHLDWGRLKNRERIESFLPLLVHFAETPGLDEWDLGLEEWLRRLKGRAPTRAAFLVRRLAALRADAFVREKVYDDIDLPLRLAASPGTPSRSHAYLPGSPVVFVRREIPRARPRLPEDLLTAPRAVRSVGPARANRIIELARAAMVARQRDLDLFCYASPRDVRMVVWDEGLRFACLGAMPSRRLLLEAVYAFLTLKNGVPVGYVLVSALFGSSEIAYNVFETYRGMEAGPIYGKVLATARHLFGSDAFTIFPYQLGHENEEAIRSGAWWFYQKIGFRPRRGEAVRLMRRELARMRRRPAHRSSPATLRALAEHNLYYFLGEPRREVIGADFLPNLGLKVSDYLAARFGSDREEAETICTREAMRLAGLSDLRGWAAGERLAWTRWAPLVCLLPQVARWGSADRRALVEVIRAKGGRRESDFVRRFDAHARLRAALIRLARG
ncbi:MAG TPA: hypothetical protein VFW45_00235 [Candidatus Polarisedimenticolia bacterium]|nr:hypothetical protein [Candidatus Polarisedimenticolia bacterium]